MAVLLDITRTNAEPSLIIKEGGRPAVWRWGGRYHDLAFLHAEWEDEEGRCWYRVESREALTFLLGRDRDGWVAALWPAAPAKPSALRAVH
jgi:hypothetical protein